MNFFKSKNGKIVIWAAVIVAIAVFVWLTRPSDYKKTTQQINNGSPAAAI